MNLPFSVLPTHGPASPPAQSGIPAFAGMTEMWGGINALPNPVMPAKAGIPLPSVMTGLRHGA